ncbi:MAG: head GIN domain-containing protein [Bacteroidota bacterium]
MRQIAILLFILLSFASCRRVTGSGNVISEKKEVGNFTGISAGSAFEVEVRIGSPVSVEIQADDNLMKLIQVKVVGNTLRIHSKNGVSFKNGHFKAFVTVPGLDHIESSGAATVNVMDEIKNSEKIELHASGAAKIKAQVDAPKIDAESSGAANIELTGKTRNLDANASGGASIHASGLMSENADAEASGAGNVHVYASVKLDASASGAGNVFYKGGAVVTKETSGAGNVNKEE